MAGNNAKKEGITIVFEGNTVSFDKSVDGIEKALKVLQKQTKRWNSEFKDSKNVDDLRKKTESLRQEMLLSAQATKQWIAKWVELANKQKALRDQNKDLDKSEATEMASAMEHYEKSAERTRKIAKNLTDAENIIRKFNDGTAQMEQNLAKAAEKMSTIGKATEKLSQASQKFLKSAVNEAVKFEEAFADVRKTLTIDDLDAEEQYKAIADALREMSTVVPVTAEELAKVAGLSAQMGVGKDELVKFTEAMVKFGTATNISAEEAAQEIAQIYNVIGKGGDFSDLDQLLSTIVDLGNHSATTEKDIVEMFRNIASASSRVGLTESQMVALASTLSSLGLDKGGASAISNIMTQIDMAVDTNSKKLYEWAKSAGMSTYKFKQAWNEDAAGAMATLLENLKQTVDAGGSLNSVFDDLGIKELRRVDTLGRLVNAQDVYADALQRADQAYKDGNALEEEAGKRWSILAAKIQLLKNKFDEFKRTIGDTLAPVFGIIVDFAGKLLDIINALPGGITTLVTIITTLLAVVSPLTSTLGNLLKSNINLTKSVKDFFGFMKSGTGVLLGVLTIFMLLYEENEDFRNAVNKTAVEIWTHLKPVLENIWAIFQQLWDIIGWVVNKIGELWEMFKNTTAGQIFIGMIETIIYTVTLAIDIIEGLIGAVKTIFGWFEKLLGIETDISTNLPRDYISNGGAFQSGGFMSGGFTVNNSFTINGTEQLSNSRLIEVADIITDRVNENLGRMV